ncbi:hypothetical protein GGF46_003172 [Coemansia sp. RSA 552]|nr:hypothetical protein GGF46_003172 [Coemansia sp. RSA 552]
MNLFRRRTRRDPLPEPANGAVKARPATLERKRLTDGSRRRSYFSIRRRDLAAEPPAATAPIKMAKLADDGPHDASGGSFKDVSRKAARTLRRHSVTGLAHLVSQRRSTHFAATEPEAAEPGPGEPKATPLLQSLRRTVGLKGERLLRQAGTSGNISDEGSSGDSDDTLTAPSLSAANSSTDLAAGETYLSPLSVLAAAAGGEQSAGGSSRTILSSASSVTPVLGAEPNGPAASNCADAEPAAPCAPDNGPSSGDVLQAATTCERVSADARVDEDSTSDVVEGATADHGAAAAAAAKEPEPISPQPESSGPQSPDSTLDAGAVECGELLRGDAQTTSLKAPRRRIQLSLGRLRTSGSVDSRTSSASSYTLASSVRSTLLGFGTGHLTLGSRKTQRMLTTAATKGALPVRKTSSPALYARRRSSGSLSRLSLTPQPTATEQAKMDAWTADDDDFSAADYDLSGAHFELPLTPTSLLASPGADQTAYSGITRVRGQKLKQLGQCMTPGSRLSSTSTAVEENGLSPDQYKRIYISSARKLQWQGPGRGMACVVHIRSIMAKANECYVVVSGGRRLEAPHPPPRDVLTALYVHRQGDSVLQAPVRTRSADCLNPHVLPVMPARRLKGPGYADDGDSEAPYTADLLGQNAGDLVSLDPIDTPAASPEQHPCPRWRSMGHLQSAFSAAAVAATTA